MFRKQLILAAVALVAGQAAAFAHHPMGGKVPDTAMNGFLSGLGHPIIGLDHALFIVAAGALVAFAGRGFSAIAAFILSSILGTLLMWSGLGLSIAETGVALSLIVAAVLLWRKDWISPTKLVPLFAIIGIAHGMALGEAVIGAETTPIAFYLLGIGVAAMGVALVAYVGTRWVLTQEDKFCQVATNGLSAILLIAGTFGFVSNAISLMS